MLSFKNSSRDQGKVAPFPDERFEAVFQVFVDIVCPVAGHAGEDDDRCFYALVGDVVRVALPGQEYAVADNAVFHSNPLKLD